jgi:hypothetical protein
LEGSEAWRALRLGGLCGLEGSAAWRFCGLEALRLGGLCGLAGSAAWRFCGLEVLRLGGSAAWRSLRFGGLCGLAALRFGGLCCHEGRRECIMAENGWLGRRDRPPFFSRPTGPDSSIAIGGPIFEGGLSPLRLGGAQADGLSDGRSCVDRSKCRADLAPPAVAPRPEITGFLFPRRRMPAPSPATSRLAEARRRAWRGTAQGKSRRVRQGRSSSGRGEISRSKVERRQIWRLDAKFRSKRLRLRGSEE